MGTAGGETGSGERGIRQGDGAAGSRDASEREQPDTRVFAERPGWNRLTEVIAERYGEPWEAIGGRHGDLVRTLSWRLARKECGMNLREIRELSQGADDAAFSAALRTLEGRLPGASG